MGHLIWFSKHQWSSKSHWEVCGIMTAKMSFFTLAVFITISMVCSAPLPSHLRDKNDGVRVRRDAVPVAMAPPPAMVGAPLYIDDTSARRRRGADDDSDYDDEDFGLDDSALYDTFVAGTDYNPNPDRRRRDADDADDDDVFDDDIMDGYTPGADVDN